MLYFSIIFDLGIPTDPLDIIFDLSIPTDPLSIIICFLSISLILLINQRLFTFISIRITCNFV